jgi:hypothetical protein
MGSACGPGARGSALIGFSIITHYHALPRITTHYHHPLPLGQRHLEKPDQKLKTPKASLAVPSEQKELQKQKQKLALEIN